MVIGDGMRDTLQQLQDAVHMTKVCSCRDTSLLGLILYTHVGVYICSPKSSKFQMCYQLHNAIFTIHSK